MLGNLFRGLIRAEEAEVQSAFSSSPTTQSSSLPSISRSPAPTHIPIEAPRHRKRALSSTSMTGSGISPSINIAGLATRAQRAAIRPEGTPFGQSAPASSGWLSPIPGGRTPFGTGMSPLSSTDTPARDYFSMRKPDPAPVPEKKEEKVTSPPAATGGLLGKKFKGFGKKKNVEAAMSTVVESKHEAPAEDTAPKMSERDKQQLLFLDGLRSQTFSPPSSVDVPQISIPDSTAVIISEQSHADGAYIVTYRSQVSSTERDMEPLEMNSPFWLLNFLFTGMTPEERRPPKIPLILLPEGQTVGSGKG